MGRRKIKIMSKIKIISRIKMTTVILDILMMTVVNGCGHRETAVENQEVTLSFMMPQSHYKEFFKEEIGRFEAEYPGYHIDVLRIPDNQWIEVTKAKAATGELTDLIRIDKGLMEDIGTGKFVEMGEEESWYGRVQKEQLDNKKIGGKLYELPVGSTSSVGLIYNVDIFEEQGIEVPKTMEEFRKVCKELKEKGYTPLFASDKDAWTAAVAFSSSASQVMTDEIFKEYQDGKAIWNTEEYRGILEGFAALRSENYTNADHIEEAKVFLEWFSAPENMNEFNAGWNHMPVFVDQKMEMADWQQNLYENYILPGKTEPEINERFSGIDMSDFWSDQQKMYMGQMSADEVLKNWDISYEKQAAAAK